MHKFLIGFMRSKDGEKGNEIYCKTIYHEGSNKNTKGQNKWLHPDIVGVKFLLDKYKSNSAKELIKKTFIYPYEFYSFEMKTKIDTSLLSEEFFQAVANSSWSHYGYLVAADIDTSDTKLYEKMKRLNNKFGIGIIKLNIEHYAQSKIILEAKYNEDIDYDSVDQLIEVNPDFNKFIEKCNEYYELKEESYKKVLIEKNFDKFYQDEDDAFNNITNN